MKRSTLVFALFLPVLAQAQEKIDISDDFPLSLAKAEKMEKISHLPATELIGFGVSEQEIRKKTIYVFSGEGEISVKENHYYRIHPVQNIKYDLLDKKVSYHKKDPKTGKNIFVEETPFNASIGGFDVKNADGTKRVFALFKNTLEPAYIKEKKVALNLKNIDYSNFAELLFRSRYLHVYKNTEVNTVKEISNKKTYLIFSFHNLNQGKKYYVTGGALEVKQQVLFLLTEYRKDAEAYIKEKKLFSVNTVGAAQADALELVKYVADKNFPKIKKEGDLELLEVELK